MDHDDMKENMRIIYDEMRIIRNGTIPKHTPREMKEHLQDLRALLDKWIRLMESSE